MPKVTQLLSSRVGMQTHSCVTQSIDIQKIPGRIPPYTKPCISLAAGYASAWAGLFQFTLAPSALQIPDHPGK